MFIICQSQQSMFCYHVRWPPPLHYALNTVFFHSNVAKNLFERNRKLVDDFHQMIRFIQCQGVNIPILVNVIGILITN
jgi:hypothetical protein